MFSKIFNVQQLPSLTSQLEAHLSGAVESGAISCANFVSVHAAALGPPPSKAVPGYSVEILTHSMVYAALSGLQGTRSDIPAVSGPRPKTYIWIPACLFDRTFPELITRYRKKISTAKVSISHCCYYNALTILSHRSCPAVGSRN